MSKADFRDEDVREDLRATLDNVTWQGERGWITIRQLIREGRESAERIRAEVESGQKQQLLCQHGHFKTWTVIQDGGPAVVYEPCRLCHPGKGAA